MTARVERVVRSVVPGAAADRRVLRRSLGRIEPPNDPGRRVDPLGAAARAAPPRRSVTAARRAASKMDNSTIPASSFPVTSYKSTTLSIGAHFDVDRSDVDDSPARDVLTLLSKLERHHGTLRVLYLLTIHDELTAYQLRKSFPIGQRALSGAIGALDSAQLIEARRARPFPYLRTTTYRLSQSGGTLGAKLLESWNLFVRAAHH